MTDAFDVSLRVKLDYQAGAAARTAVADLGAIESTAKRLGAASTVLAVARDLGELRKGADMARAGMAELEAAGARLNRAGAGSSALSSELGRVKVEAATAGRAVDALGDKLGAALKAQRAAGGFKSGAELEAFLKAFDAQTKVAGAQVSALGATADRLGASAGPRNLAEGIGTVAAGAREARREVTEVGEAAARAARDLGRMSAAHGPAAGGGAGGHGGDGGQGNGGASGRHNGPGGWRGAAVAAARPLHMERLLMSAMTPVGLAGLGAGLGVAGVAHQIQDATRRAIELEDALNDIRRSTGTMSAEGVKALEGDIVRTSRATGETTGALARMGAEAAAAGRPAEDLPRFMDLGAKAAGAFGTKVDEVGARLTRIGADFGLDQRGLEAAADTAALLQERTGARGAGTLDFMAQAGGSAKLAGFAPDRLAAYGATFGHLGMAPGDAASTFTGLLEKLESAPMQGGGFKTGLSRIAGPNGAPESPYALRQAVRADPSSGMIRFLEDVQRLPQGRRQTVLTEMFGSDDGDKIARISDHLDDLKRNLATVQDTAGRSGAVERVFKVFDEATSKKIDRATAAIGAFATKMGQSFAPAVGAAADATSRFFGGWLDRMDRLEQASEIADKIAKGVALAPDQQKRVDTDPALKAEVGRQVDAVGVARATDKALAPDPEAGRRREMERMGAAPAAAAGGAEAARERDRLGRVEAIRQLKDWARTHGEASVADDLRDQLAAYAQDFPDKPLPAFAGGGRVSGPGGPRDDKVHALLSAGEFVVNAASAARHHGLLRAINDNALPGFADGGAVGALTAAAPSASLDKLQDAVQAGVKAGVVEGLRDADMRRVGPAFGGGGPDSGAGSEGDGNGAGEGSGEGGSRRRSIRYGGGFAPARGGRASGSPGSHRSVRYGGGYGPHGPGTGSHPAYGGAVPGANGRGTIDAPYTAPLDQKGEGGKLSPRELFGYLKAHGATDNEATMLTGAAGSESSFNPDAVHDVNGKNGPGHGLWGHNDHRLDMRGKSWQQQADLALGEVKRDYADRVNGAKTPEELADAEMHYERPRGYGPRNPRGGENYTGRANTLRRFGNEFGTMKSSAGVAGGPPNDPHMLPANSDRRGFANLMHGQYGAPGQKLTTVMTPGGHKVTVHAAAADSFRGFLGDLEKSGYNINSLGGYANRGMAGNPGRISQHAYGNAIDINPQQNPFHTSKTDLPRNVSEMAAKWGLSWGGDWSERSRDPMHFEWNGSRPWENKQGPAATAQNKPPVMPFGLTGTALEAMDKARAAKAVAAVEDRVSRSTVAERQAARPQSPRFTDPGLKSAYDTKGGAAPGASADARGRGGASPHQSVVQNFYGQHDPRETASHARRESNREIKRSQARALHSVGRPA